MSRVHVRPRSSRSQHFDIAAVQSVLDAFGHKSVWSGTSENLTIVRIDKGRPLSRSNAMVVEIREATQHVPSDVAEKASAVAKRELYCDSRSMAAIV